MILSGLSVERGAVTAIRPAFQGSVQAADGVGGHQANPLRRLRKSEVPQS